MRSFGILCVLLLTSAAGGSNVSRLIGITYPDAGAGGREITLGYGATNSIDDNFSRIATISDGTGALAAYQYAGVSRRVGTTLGCGVSTSVAGGDGYDGLDRFGRLLRLHWEDGGLLHSYDYTYDQTGNRLTAAVTQAAGGATLPDRSYEYGYDGLRRLVDAKLGELDPNGHVEPSTNTPVPRHTQWILDNLGNFSGGDPNSGSVILTEDDGNGDLQTTLTHHATGGDNAIQSVTIDPPGGSPATQAFVYDIAGNLVFGAIGGAGGVGVPPAYYYFQYDGLNRLVQVNAAGSLTAGDFDAAGAPDDPNAFEPGDLMARYVYDGLGRLIVRQVPLSRGSLSSWDPLVQTEHYYYDGVRRIQSVITREPNDLILVATVTFNELFLDVPPTEVYEYVWGPDYVDELVCQYNDPNGAPFWALTDANYNVMAVIDGDCEVVEQYVYDPYGGLLAVEPLDPNATVLNRVAHQGLFFERFADDILSPPLDVGAPGAYYNRNRHYEPYLSRFLQKDVNETSQPIMMAHAANGARLSPTHGLFDLTGHYADGMNLFGYTNANPVSRTDAAGLSWDDDIDSFINDRIGHAFYALGTINESARWASIGLKTATDIAWSLLPGSGLYDAFKAVDIIQSGRGGFWEAMDIATAAFPVAKLAGDGIQAFRGLLRGRVYSGIRACNCFVAGTQIHTTAGSVPIECLDVGDVVLTKHHDDPGNRAIWRPVTRIFTDVTSSVVWLSLATSQVLGVTPEHEVWAIQSSIFEDSGSNIAVQGRWTNAGSLVPGDFFVDADGHAVQIIDISLDATPCTVFNIEIDGTFTYYAEGVWVHNNSCSWPSARNGFWRMFGFDGPPKRVAKVRHKDGSIGYKEVTMELHHINGRAIDNPHDPSNLMPMWPWEHANIDRYRRLDYTFLGWWD